MGFFLHNGQPVHTSFLREAVEAPSEPAQTEITMSTDTTPTLPRAELLEKLEEYVQKHLWWDSKPIGFNLLRACLAELKRGEEERQRSEEALGWALALIAHEDAYWSNTTGYAMAERVFAVLQERMGKPVSLPVKDGGDELRERLERGEGDTRRLDYIQKQGPPFFHWEDDLRAEIDAAMSSTAAKEGEG